MRCGWWCSCGAEFRGDSMLQALEFLELHKLVCKVHPLSQEEELEIRKRREAQNRSV
jgi:hypothetical protein